MNCSSKKFVFGKIEGIIPATPSEIINYCRNIPSELRLQNDTFIYSPVYYLFTGRNGIWRYDTGHEVEMIVRHPNLQDSFLLLPAFDYSSGRISPTMTIEIANQLRECYPMTNITLGRVPIEYHSKFSLFFEHRAERTLDWAFPCHILSTSLVDKMFGKHFQQVRQRINQLDTDRCIVSNIDIANDSMDLLQLVYSWAEAKNLQKYTINDFISPSETLLKLFQSNLFNLLGLKIKIDDRIESFCILEICNNVANEFSIVTNTQIPGLADYQVQQMCHFLNLIGVEYVNLGGSESKGLDRFKRKFYPIISHSLSSYRIV